MNTSWRLALLVPLACAAACSEPIQTDTDPDACVPAATLPSATCAEGVLSRHDAPTQLRSGPATVTRLDAEPGGRANLALDADGVTTILSLPAAPSVAVGDTLAIEIDAVGAIVLRDEGRLVAYIGPRQLAAAGSTAPVDVASLLEANREGAPLSIDVAGLSLTLEPACGGWVAHHGALYGCPDVPLVAFSVRHGDTTVLPGERAIAPLEDGLALAIENRGVHARESPSCGECADLWSPSFGVTLVVTPSAIASGAPGAE